MAALFPQRPARASADLTRHVSTFTRFAPDPSDPAFRDWPVENPWIVPAVVDAGDPVDETHWLTVESDQAVSGAIRGRIAQLLGGGVQIERGEGDGADELFEFWDWAVAELPLTTIMSLALRSIFRGWTPFEVVGADREWEGRPVFAPIVVKDALSYQFRWTVGGDLIFQPGGLAARGYRMGTLPAQMKWWCPRSGSLASPYGHPMHRDYLALDLIYRQLSEVGFVQIKQAQGFLKVSEVTDLTEAFAEGDASKVDEVVTYLNSVIEEMAATGILVDAQGMKVDWVALTSALDGWVKLFEWFGDQARSFYSGGNLTSMVSGDTGSRAVGEVQERGGNRLAALDATCLQEQFRRGFLWPWSARNASIIAPGAFPGIGPRPQLRDVRLRAVPRLSFRSLNRLRQEDLEVLKILSEVGIVDSSKGAEPGPIPPGQNGNGAAPPPLDKPAPIRIDAAHIVENTRLRVLPEDQDGPILDLGTKAPPPSPFGQNPDSPKDGEDTPPDADEESPVPGRRV